MFTSIKDRNKFLLMLNKTYKKSIKLRNQGKQTEGRVLFKIWMKKMRHYYSLAF